MRKRENNFSQPKQVTFNFEERSKKISLDFFFQSSCPTSVGPIFLLLQGRSIVGLLCAIFGGGKKSQHLHDFSSSTFSLSLSPDQTKGDFLHFDSES